MLARATIPELVLFLALVASLAVHVFARTHVDLPTVVVVCATAFAALPSTLSAVGSAKAAAAAARIAAAVEARAAHADEVLHARATEALREELARRLRE